MKCDENKPEEQTDKSKVVANIEETASVCFNIFLIIVLFVGLLFGFFYFHLGPFKPDTLVHNYSIFIIIKESRSLKSMTEITE